MSERNSAFDEHSSMVDAVKTEDSQDQDSEEKPAAVPPPTPAELNKVAGRQRTWTLMSRMT